MLGSFVPVKESMYEINAYLRKDECEDHFFLSCKDFSACNFMKRKGVHRVSPWTRSMKGSLVHRDGPWT